MVEGETISIGFSILGLAVCECCVDKLVEADDEYVQKLSDQFTIIESSNVIGHPNNVLIIGRDVEKLDENKTIKQLKEEIELELIEFGIISDDVTRHTEEVCFLNGSILYSEEELNNDEDDEDKSFPGNPGDVD